MGKKYKVSYNFVEDVNKKKQDKDFMAGYQKYIESVPINRELLDSRKKYNIENRIKGYIIANLDEIIEMIQKGNNNFPKILKVSKEIVKLVIEPTVFYVRYTEAYGIHQNDMEKAYLDLILQDKIIEINMTERMVIKSLLFGTIMSDMLEEEKDFGAIKVKFLAIKEMLLEGLDEDSINYIEYEVKPGDILKKVKVHYNNQYKYTDINKHNYIGVKWNDIE